MSLRLFTASLLLACLPLAGAVAADDAQRADAAKAAIKGLAENLGATLKSAIATGGPVEAIDACRVSAPDIAATQSKAHGLEIGRTALKVRNPNNAPDAWETKVLESFAAKIDAGADPATVAYAETVEIGGHKVFRFMKAIPMAAEPCMACHGSELKPEIAAEIAKRYPKDQATGFVPGKLRGAFTVKIAAD